MEDEETPTLLRIITILDRTIMVSEANRLISIILLISFLILPSAAGLMIIAGIKIYRYSIVKFGVMFGYFHLSNSRYEHQPGEWRTWSQPQYQPAQMRGSSGNFSDFEHYTPHDNSGDYGGRANDQHFMERSLMHLNQTPLDQLVAPDGIRPVGGPESRMNRNNFPVATSERRFYSGSKCDRPFFGDMKN